jgi:uncharacterized repeat protein (TIGR03803 family)
MSGLFYGLTYSGGANDRGAVYSIDSMGTHYVLLNSLNGTDGAAPSASLIQGSDGAFYGTVSAGGVGSSGGQGGVIQVGSP